MTVAKGAVTIVAAGDQSYYLGEEVQFSGTNTESQNTYLFISGPNLGQDGAAMAPADNNPRGHPLAIWNYRSECDRFSPLINCGSGSG